MKAIVITESERGIFVGHAMGLAFWSNCDPAGQTMIPTFESVEQARAMIDAWEFDADMDITFHEVECEDEYFASIEELENAGLREHFGKLLEERAVGLAMH